MTDTAGDLRTRLEALPPAALAAVRDKLAARVQARRYALWEPYEWQRCPGVVPAMGAWVLGGGRGVGKTDAGARYILDHVAGPACDPRLPGGHRVAIIAPTLGDASESAIMGPSGLKTHDPRVRMTTGHGGTHVVFPNGARGKVFGAHTAADIERLRSGGNRCVAEGTLVQAERGPVPIGDIRPGERVWTRNGLRSVLHVWDNGVRTVERFVFDGGSVWLTPDHQVWTSEGWKEAQFVRTNDTLHAWEPTENQSPTPASSGTPERTATTRTNTAAYSTGSCGKSSTAPSPTGCTCTTSTTTSETTGSTTLSLSRQLTIGPSTEMSGVPTGTALGAPLAGVTPLTGTCGAPCAVKLSAAEPRSPRSTVGSGAGTERHDRSPNGCAWCAANGSPSERGLRRAPVRESARLSTPTRSAVARVYDLTVEHDHEFFAGGLLVANCCVWLEEAAAMRYLDEVMTHSKMGLRLGPRPHYVVTTTPKPRAAIIKLWDDPRTLLTKGRTLDAYHLPPEQRAVLLEEYGGTDLGRQELEGEILTEVRGALVSRKDIDRARVPEAPDMNLVVVGFDPNGTGTGDESGIVVCGRGLDGDTYILADASSKATGRDAALRAWAVFDDAKADVMVYEKNIGQSWLTQVLADAWREHNGVGPGQYCDPAPMKPVNASQGKALRAQPMAMRFEQGKVHVVGVLDRLEYQFATWVPDESPDSPDRVDAAVHAFTYLRGRERMRGRVQLPHTVGSLRA